MTDLRWTKPWASTRYYTVCPRHAAPLYYSRDHLICLFESSSRIQQGFLRLSEELLRRVAEPTLPQLRVQPGKMPSRCCDLSPASSSVAQVVQPRRGDEKKWPPVRCHGPLQRSPCRMQAPAS